MREWGLTPPQWRDLDESDRDLILAESALVCPSCGNLKSVCSQPGLTLYPQRDECYVTAARALAVRRIHQKYDEEPDTTGLHPIDGVSVWMAETDLNPGDRFFDLGTSTPDRFADRVAEEEGDDGEHGGHQ